MNTEKLIVSYSQDGALGAQRVLVEVIELDSVKLTNFSNKKQEVRQMLIISGLR